MQSVTRRPFPWVCACACVVALLVCAPIPASSGPIVLTYEQHYYETHEVKIANGQTLQPVIFVTKDILQLPRFDSALGTLLSVDLRFGGNIFAHMITHCVGPISCNTEATAAVGSGLSLFPTESDLGVSLGTPLSLSASGSRSCSFTTFPVADCSRQWFGSDAKSRQLTFTGADMDGFVGAFPFTFKSLGVPHMAATLGHDGFPPSGAGGPGDVDAAGSGDVADVVLAALELAYELYINDVFANHEAAYSDAHLHADEHVFAKVAYTYEPAASVPEPASAALLGLGLAVLGVSHRIKNWVVGGGGFAPLARRIPGVDGLAVVSAMAGAPDPRGSAEEVRSAMLRARPA